MEHSQRQVLLLNKGAVAAPASIYQPESEAIFASFTTPPTTDRKARIDAYVVAGKAGGWWGKFDVKHEYMAADAQAALINWAQPGTYNGVAVNSPTFTADKGFTGAATKYIDTGFNATTAPAPKFTRNDANAFVWGMSTAPITAPAFGTLANGTGQSDIYPKNWNGYIYSSLNLVAAISNAIIVPGGGFVSSVRTNSTTIIHYLNGVAVHSIGTATSDIPLNSNLVFLQGTGGSSYTDVVSSGGFGSQLTAGQQLTLYQAELAYQAGIATDKIVASFTTPPTAGRTTLIYQYVYAMMDAGAWTDADADYWFAAADAQASLINLVNPGTYNAVAVNSPTFTADQGWTGAATKYLDTGFNPATAPSPKFVQNSATVFAWSLTNISSAGTIVGQLASGAGETIIMPRTGSAWYAYVNDSSGDTFGSVDSSGFLLQTRRGAASKEIYRNGVSVSTKTGASQAPQNSKIVFLNRAGTSWDGQIASGGIAAQYSATKQLAVYNAKRAYMQGLPTTLTYSNPETGAIIGAFTTPPTQARVNLLDAYVTAMKAAGAWTDADADYWFAAADAQAALINLTKPGTYNAVAVNSPTFTADRGFTGNGTTSYIDANFNPNTAPLPKYTLNDANVSVWPLNNIQDSGQLFGVTNPHSMINPRYINDTFFMRLNNNTTNTGGASLDCRGLWAISRTGASASEGFKNGVSVGTNAGGATQVPSACWFLRGETYYSTNQVASGSLGASRNATKQLAVYNAKRAYATGVGIP